MNDIDAERWRRLRPLLDRALDLEGAAREAFLEGLAREDPRLHEDVRRLLAADAGGPRTARNPLSVAASLVDAAGGAASHADESRVGADVGRYRLTRLLGVGGMGAVYLAERSEGGFGQRVALKIMHGRPGGARDLPRFEHERRILARLVHPNIAALYDGGETAGGEPFYTMEYVDGAAVTDYCDAHAAPVTTRVRLLVQAATALAYAHQNLVVHRDIKPSNVLVTADGRVKLVDFGIAKLMDEQGGAALTRAGAGPMTPEYAAPEQFRNGAITAATDVYQFGVLCFRVLSGRYPYRVDPADSLAWARAVTEEEPLSLSRALDARRADGGADERRVPSVRRRQLRGDLDAIVRKALAKAPADRYRSMDALIADLEAFLGGRPVAARRAGPAYFFWRFVVRRRYAVAAVALAGVALGVAALVALRQAHIATREAERANAVAGFLVSLFQVSDPGVNRGQRLSANEILDRGAARLQTEMAAQPLQRARLLSVIGEVYSALGDFPRARTPLETSIAIQRAAADRDPVDLAHALRTLAWVRHRQGDPKAALSLLAEAEPLLAGSSPRALDELAGVHSYRALARKALGDFAGAEAELRAGLAIADRAGAADSPKTAAIHNNLGLLLRDRGAPKEARAEFEHALAIYRREYGEDHYRTIGTTQNLAMAMLDGGDVDEAKAVLERTAAANLKLFGEASTDYANAENMLGNIARDRKHYDESLALYAKAEASYRAALGEHHPYLAFPAFNMGETELARGNYAAALDHFQRALDLRRRSLPADHPEVADSLDARARALMALHRFDEARADDEAALAIRRAKLGADAPQVVQSLAHLGFADFALTRSGEARAAWDEALERAVRAYAPDSPELAGLRADIADPAAALRRISP